MTYYHELLLMTLMSYVKLLTNFLRMLIFIKPSNYNKARQYSETIMKSTSLPLFLWGIEREY